MVVVSYFKLVKDLKKNTFRIVNDLEFDLVQSYYLLYRSPVRKKPLDYSIYFFFLHLQLTELSL